MTETRLPIRYHHITSEEPQPQHVGERYWFDGQITTPMLAIINASRSDDDRVSVDDIRERIDPFAARLNRVGNFIVARGRESISAAEGGTGSMVGACILRLAEVTTDDGELDEMYVSELHVAPWVDELPVVASMLDAAQLIVARRQIEQLRIPADIAKDHLLPVFEQRDFLPQQDGSQTLDVAAVPVPQPR